MGVATAVLCVLRFPRAARGAEAAHVDGASPAQPGNSYEYAQRSAIQVSACMWACGHVRMWACGHVDMWACGHVGMWACMHATSLSFDGRGARGCMCYLPLTLCFVLRTRACIHALFPLFIGGRACTTRALPLAYVA